MSGDLAWAALCPEHPRICRRHHDPQGYRYLESFALDGALPVWVFALGDALLERRLWMAHGQNTSYLSYHLLRGAAALTLEVIPLVTHRDFHSLGSGEGWRPQERPERLPQVSERPAFL